MAEPVPTLPDRPAPKTPGSKLDVWLDGRVWKLTIGDDAKDADGLLNLQRGLYRRGKQRGLKVRIARRADALIVQARPIEVVP